MLISNVEDWQKRNKHELKSVFGQLTAVMRITGWGVPGRVCPPCLTTPKNKNSNTNSNSENNEPVSNPRHAINTE